MTKTITVKGTGAASAKPDLVVLSMTLESKHKDYAKAMELAAGHIQRLNDALCVVGFEKDSVKTTDFSVNTDYARVKEFRNETYEKVFRGYEVTHRLKLSFDFDMGRLAKALSAIAGCLSHPELSISFTVKDATALSEETLRSATINAKRKAEVLCAAAGATLGELISINYNWGELNIYSHTRYECCEEAMGPMIAGSAVDITPEDIDVKDTATFVWEIK